MLPQMNSITIAAATGRANEQFFGLGISRFTHSFPPLGDAFDRELCSVGSHPDVDPSHIFSNIINSIWHRLWHLWVREIMAQYLDRLGLFFPFMARVFILANEFLLFSVDRYDRKTLAQESFCPSVNILKLVISIGMIPLSF